MEIPLSIKGDLYDEITIECWQAVWKNICQMTYEGNNICESIITRPDIMTINGRKVYDKREKSHSQEYARIQPTNSHLLTLDHIWKQYSGTELIVVPEFKNLVVPYPLFQTLGVNSWFKYSFPNCKVSFWKI